MAQTPAEAFSLAGKVDSARIELNYVINKSPRYRDAYIYLVNMEDLACNYLQALEYADMGLKYFPNDRDLLLKKLNIYVKMGDWMESNRLADYLFDRFSADPFIRSVYLDYKLSVARQYSHRGYIEIAKRAYEAVLEQDPLNKEALSAIYALDIRSGNYESSLAYTNRALQSTPNSYEYLMKKVAILDAMSRYVEAIAVVEKLMKLYPTNADVQRLNPARPVDPAIDPHLGTHRHVGHECVPENFVDGQRLDVDGPTEPQHVRVFVGVEHLHGEQFGEVDVVEHKPGTTEELHPPATARRPQRVFPRLCR